MAGGKLLFITSNRLGDAVLATGLLQAALLRFKPSEVTVACGPLPAPLFKGVPHIKEIFIIDKQKGGRHWMDLWKHAKTQKWDVVIDLRNSIVSHFISAKQKFRFTRADKALHKTQQLAKVLGLNPPPASKIWITPDARNKAIELMPSGARILALCPTANWMGKAWPWQRYVELAQKLTAEGGPLQGARIAVFAAPSEREQAEPLIKALHHTNDVIDLVGKTDPLEAAACLAYCRLCIANDSGLMHIAAAMRVPTLGLFGGTPDVEYRPWGPNTGFVRGAPYPGEGKAIVAGPALMEAISVEDALAAAQKLLAS
jgi:lipopolysaccharide export system permease protein